MSHTNSTTHYSLPQFVGTDTPGWLTDVNAAMLALDNAIYARQQAIAANTEAITANTASINGHTTRIESAENDISALETDVDAAETNISNLQTLTQQHTSQISSIANTITNLDAADVSYDNTASGMTATTVQEAIDELRTGEASTVIYTNQTPGNDQAAFVVSDIDLSGYSAIDVFYAGSDYGIQSLTAPLDFDSVPELNVALTFPANLGSAAPIQFRYRSLVVKATEISIGGGLYKNTNVSASPTMSNAICKVIKITAHK